MPHNQEQESWEENLRLWYKDKYPGYPSEKELEWIIDFIRTLLSSRDKELREKVEKLDKNIIHLNPSFPTGNQYGAYKRAIDDVLALLTPKENIVYPYEWSDYGKI